MKRTQTRAVTASRFKDTRLSCSLSVREAGKLFRVSERTIRNWEAGRVGIPYAAFKLMRILRGYELPGKAWKGYRLQGSTLWSPEGLPFHSHDATWWSLTVRMAHEFVRSRLGQSLPVLAQGVAARVSEANPPSRPRRQREALVDRLEGVLASAEARPVSVPGPLLRSQTPQIGTLPPRRRGVVRVGVRAANPPSSNTGENQTAKSVTNHEVGAL